LIKTRRKKIGTEDWCVDDEPDVNEFLLEMNVRKGSDSLEEVETVEDKESWLEQNPATGDDAVEMFPEGHLNGVLPPEHEDHVKREDLRHKSRLVIGGHVIDSSKHSTYSSTVQDISIWLLQLVAPHNKLNIVTGDVSNAFCTAPVA